MDYTMEGIRNHQMDIAVSELYLMDKKLSKISRNVTILTLLAIGTVVVKNADRIREAINNLKGE